MKKPYTNIRTSIRGGVTTMRLTGKVGPSQAEIQATSDAIAHCRGPKPDITSSMLVIEEYIATFGEEKFLQGLEVQREELATWRTVARASKQV